MMKTRVDTTSCNAAITACDRGQAWQQALHIFHLSAGLRDVISFSASLASYFFWVTWGVTPANFHN